MRIGIDCRQIWNPEKYEGAGVAHYLFFLLKSLAKIDQQNDYFLFFKRGYDTTQLTFLTSNYHRMTWNPSHGNRLVKFVEQVHWRSALKKMKLDVFHSPAYTLPLWYTGASIVTVHDLAIYTHPEWFPEQQWLSTKVLVPRSIKKATHIIAVSDTTKKEIEERFHIPSERIGVIYEGVLSTKDFSGISVGEQQTFDKKHEPQQESIQTLLEHIKDQKYILSVNTLEPRKNMTRLIQAFEHMQHSHPEPLHFIIAGSLGWKYEEIFRAMKNSPCKQRIHYVGYITQEEKYTLLRNAVVFVCVSLWEGFGLSNLEAMSCDTPVLASHIPAFREVLGDAAYFVDPYDVKAIAQGLQELLTNTKLRRRYQQFGKKRTQEFSWQQCAEQTLRIYNVCRDQ
ncbi:MAG: hypothetical protein A3B74_04480 [Candidatus Kerfeldbacteria bacterium RIFCSPHIGHO2_02_FULL_42_14]|uniref:Glycosyl transferase family 1 domain-containing protein n=1 Tax=Candidatus Kerfeldbacteria bacterium RIFCSPHIGHO2_02_FULL_42_14 TaxID=1798540 RepID=A0A1G2ARF8_9BACT|nr:MAG: hypothetical protein A3B74_04480 [Candidatus Kerfeldbacteria bacterium RIFCSPHIGHO2_02_FULL_42_14]OGY80808.1 MAG: hypothetical protein A3E60_01340 [Candidatus Kerfeldbacteria bacterium RIFCSPHIGHO2_12_FULL_42_13]OGY84979.1 MAG: hypothetical protein A3I91_00675 [Candidatus Kerfeldbacteria bacterium RIFCSPLOWO2_02_FULL_42_19]OGY86147.1 MAG: hypothetical protein A3G01_02210 [Candidatus Kerfeldbacteria bacterium RIFCSPLOWO2_12_FULL_43_9]